MVQIDFRFAAHGNNGSTSTDIVADLSEDSDLPVPQVQSLLTQDYVECSLYNVAV